MSGSVQYDPDELERTAASFTRTVTDLSMQARSLRSSVHSMTRFQGREADQFRQRLQETIKSLERVGGDLEQHARSLKKLAADVRSLRMR